MAWYWLSFLDPDKNLNLGCCNVEADNAMDAVLKTHSLGINPGGEVMIWEVPYPEQEPDRLYKREDLLSKGYKFLRKKQK